MTKDQVVQYRNPIATGMNPDPSAVYVDGIFYMVTSSFHVFPGLPIYASKDLREWKHIGTLRASHAFNRTEQLMLLYSHSRIVNLGDGNEMIATGGIQAPTIRYHKGKFYVVGSTILREDPSKPARDQFIVSTDDIWSNNWSDPITFDFYGIDTSLHFDHEDNDRVYVQGSWMTDLPHQPHCLICQLELGLNTGKTLVPPRLIWEGDCGIDTEGPHIYKRDGWYYLLAPEGGSFEQHRLSIARSRDIWGPYESYQYNPIMTAEGTSEFIQGVGHGELFQDADGDWWAVVLGFRSLPNGVWPLGRESFLAKADWPEGGWPKVQQPKMVFEAKAVPRQLASLPSPSPVDKFVTLRGRDHSSYQLPRAGDPAMFTLRPSSVTLDALSGLLTFLGRRQQEMTCTTQATLDVSDALKGQAVLAGLALHLDPLRFAYVACDFAMSKLEFHITNVRSQPMTVSCDLQPDTKHMDLKIEATPEQYTFHLAQRTADAQAEKKQWQKAGSVPIADIWMRFFTGPIFGIFAQGRADESLKVTFWDYTLNNTIPAEEVTSHL